MKYTQKFMFWKFTFIFFWISF